MQRHGEGTLGCCGDETDPLKVQSLHTHTHTQRPRSLYLAHTRTQRDTNRDHDPSPGLTHTGHTPNTWTDILEATPPSGHRGYREQSVLTVSSSNLSLSSSFSRSYPPPLYLLTFGLSFSVRPSFFISTFIYLCLYT